MSTVKAYHDSFYTHEILNLDEQGNDFNKIASLWVENSNPLRVLDVGCGAGAVTSELVRRGHSVQGLDIQDEAVGRASARGLVAQVFDLNQPLPFGGEHFDVVVAADVVEHLFDPIAMLREIRRVLKDSGYALIIIPQHFDIIQRVRMLLGLGIVNAEHLHYSRNFRPWNYAHIRFFTIKEAFEIIDSASFVVEQVQFTGLSIFFKFPWRLLFKGICNRYTRRLVPSLFSSGVRLRVRKQVVSGTRIQTDSLGTR